ncbi:MAG: hypothetical protein AAGD11_05925, partial [Planctomycetota bacterium]
MFQQAVPRLFAIVVIWLATDASCSSAGALSGPVTEAELARSKQWAVGKFSGKVTELPFSFVYGDQSSRDLLPNWTRTAESKSLDEHRTQHRVTLTDPETQLIVRCVAVEYHDYPAVEWTVYFRNDGPKDTPLLSEILAVDLSLRRGGTAEYVLHHNKGAPASGTDYQPFETSGVSLGPSL